MDQTNLANCIRCDVKTMNGNDKKMVLRISEEPSQQVEPQRELYLTVILLLARLKVVRKYTWCFGTMLAHLKFGENTWRWCHLKISAAFV